MTSYNTIDICHAAPNPRPPPRRGPPCLGERDRIYTASYYQQQEDGGFGGGCGAYSIRRLPPLPGASPAPLRAISGPPHWLRSYPSIAREPHEQATRIEVTARRLQAPSVCVC